MKLHTLASTMFVACSSLLYAKGYRPNIVVFLVDDMGVMDTSVPFVVDAEGKPSLQPLNEIYRTPSMKKLAANGVRFSHFYANSVCSPSRSSLLNGQYSARHKTTQWIDPQKKNAGPKSWNWQGITPKDITLQSLLQKDGYATIHVGKAHLGPFKHVGENPEKVGFDINIAGCAIGRPTSYFGEKNYGKGTVRGVPGLEKYHGSDTFLTEALTLEAKEAISKIAKLDKPFFLHMSHYAVHAPFDLDKRFAAHYAEEKNRRYKGFKTLVEGMDKSLGDLVTHLEKIGEAENTLIIFLGDNGSDAPIGGKHAIAASAPYRGMKATHYEGGMLAPLIFSWAKPNPENPIQKKYPIKPGIVSDDFVTIVDLMPTILTVTNTDIPKSHEVDGEEITSYLATHKGNHKQQFLMHFPHVHRSSHFTVYRDRDWKVIKHYGKGAGKGAKPSVELFNLKKDIGESNNLAQSNKKKTKEMLGKMQKLLDECGAQYSSE